MEKNDFDKDGLKKLLDDGTLRNFAMFIPLKAQERKVAVYTDESGIQRERMYRLSQFTPEFQRKLLDKQVDTIFMAGDVCKARLISGELIELEITDPSDWVGPIFG